VIRKSSVCAALIAIAGLAVASSSFADCTHPPPFEKMPDGARASPEQMKDANARVKQYVTDLGSYIKCVDAEAAPAQDSAQLNDTQRQEQADRESARIEKHNAAVAEQQAIRDTWHDVLEAYKSKHPS
jgi:hypothetical protein